MEWMVSLHLVHRKTLAVCGFSILDSRLSGSAPANFPSTRLVTVTDGKLHIPADLAQTTLQVMTGSNSFQITGDDAHGVKECYVDKALNSLSSFEDGEGNVWFGSSGVFGLICDTSTGDYDGGSGTLNPPVSCPAERGVQPLAQAGERCQRQTG